MSIPPWLVEKDRNLILTQIKSNIVTQLAAVRADRADPSVNVEPPVSYFIFSNDQTYQCPAIFVIADSGNVNEDQTKPNYVEYLGKMFVSAVVESTDGFSLTIKSERYQAALFQCLHWQTLVDPVENVKLWVRIKRFQFSPLYTKKRTAENMGSFRKEVSLELEVKHSENPNS